MKRATHPQRPQTLYATWPLMFWRRCCICKNEFRREPGWDYLERGYVFYICHECAPEETDAINIILSGRHRGPRPPHP